MKMTNKSSSQGYSKLNGQDDELMADTGHNTSGQINKSGCTNEKL